MSLFTRRLQSSGLCRLDNCNNSERSSRRFIKTTAPSPNEETTYQVFDPRNLSTVTGYKELNSAHFWMSVMAECLSCYIYVFIVCSTRISWTGSVIGHEPSLIAMALSSGVAMMLLILTFRTVHVNPALTIAFFLTGRIPFIRAALYVLVHCIGSLAAVTSLYSISVKGHAGALGLDNPHDKLTSWQILTVEVVISFVVTLTTYAACNYSSYTSARKFVLEQAVGSENGLLFSDLFSASSTCDNIAVISNHQTTNYAQQQSGISNIATTPVFPRVSRNSTNFRIHPQQQTVKSVSTNGFLTEMYANEEANSDYDCEYDGSNQRVYANSQQNHKLQTQRQHSADSASPIGSGANINHNRVPPIEELMQNESQLLASNGFSLRITVGQAFVVGLAYTLTSLTGIPASGASLNPARSFGPAFIMNRWDRHWIYWIGPIAGAIVAGLFYEFIFSPTKKSSLCYLPKLFRLSAHDMAKVCWKSRLFHHQQHHQQLRSQKLSPFTTAGNLYPTAPNVYRSQAARLNYQMPSTIQHSPNARLNNGLGIANMNQQHSIAGAASTSLAQLQQSKPHIGGNSIGCEDLNYLQQQQPQMIHQAHFDNNRSKSTAIINLIATKQQQSTVNLPQQNIKNPNVHSASSSNGSSSHTSSNNYNHNQTEFGKFSNSTISSKGFNYDHQAHLLSRTVEQQHRPSLSALANTIKPAFSEL